MPYYCMCTQVGHALHDLRPAFQSVSYSADVVEILTALGYERPMGTQSMYIFKVNGSCFLTLRM